MKMMFSRSSQRTNPLMNNNNNNNNDEIVKAQPTNLDLLNRGSLSIFNINNNIRPQGQINQMIRNTSNDSQTMKWGKPTWYLLHTLSIKIKDEKFNQLKSDLLQYIYIICCNLPCPYCAQHAKQHLDSINFNSINTKSELIDILYSFHNQVNKNKGYDLFNHNDLIPMYTKANTTNIINNFIYYYSDNYRSPKLMANDLSRKTSLKQFRQWISNNIYHFN